MYSYLETSVVKVLIYILMLFIFTTTVLIRHLWQLKTVVFLHWFLKHAALLIMAVKCFMLLAPEAKNVDVINYFKVSLVK